MSWGRRSLWTAACAASLLLLGFVLAQIDWGVAREVFAQIDYRWVALGVALLLIEGLITAARLLLLARRRDTRLGEALRATAWYVLMLMGLPARLGEIAGVAVIVRYMHESAGAAAASLLFQRLFDMIILLLILACVIGFSWSAGGALGLGLIGMVILSMLAVLIYLEELLGFAAQTLRRRRRGRWARPLLRLLLQARSVRRHHMDRHRIVSLGSWSLAKWAVNLGGIGCVVAAVVPALPSFNALAVGIVYNLAAVVPIQTIGGFGISEAVLLGSFKWLGYSLALGAPIAIAIRLALISAPLLFWILVVGFARERNLTNDSG